MRRATSSESCGRAAKSGTLICLHLILGEQSLADDVLLNLAGALADEQERRVTHQPLDFVFLGVAVATVDAETLLGDFGAILAAQVFGHPGGDVIALTRVLQARRV